MEHKEYSSKGLILIEGNYNDNGVKTGLWKEYYKNGKIAVEEIYFNGKLNGEYKSYHENGNVWCIGNYNNGNKEGNFEIYNQSGKLIIILQFVNNRLVKQDFFETVKI